MQLNQNSGQPGQSLGFSSFRSGMMVVETVMGFFSQTVEVFLRHDFGERYFSFLGVFGSLVTYLIFLVAGIKFFSSGSDAKFLGLFFLCAFALCLYHHWQIWQRQKTGQMWHSRYSGTPYFVSVFPNLDVHIIRRWIEPVVVGSLGFLLSSLGIEQALGAWLFFAGFSLAARESLAASRQKGRILDAIDADIESRNMREAIVERKPPTQTEGFDFPVPKSLSKSFKERLVSSMSQVYEQISLNPETSPTAPENGNAQEAQNTNREAEKPRFG